MSKLELISEFNNLVLQFLDQLHLITNKPRFKKYNRMISQIIDCNIHKPIDNYCTHIYPYHDQINNRDSNFFLNENFNTSDSEILIEIVNLKDIWNTLTDENQECVFDYIVELTKYAHAYLQLVLIGK